MKERCRVPVAQLRRVWNPGQIGIETTEDAPGLDGLVGQERAVAALNFGLGMRSHGYNIFVAGPAGTGKTSYTCSVTNAHAASMPVASDWVYVHNFDRPDEPFALELPPGAGPAFARDLRELVRDARTASVRALESREHQSQRAELARQARQHVAAVMQELETIARDAGFGLTQTDHGLIPVPLLKGQPLTEAQFAEMPLEQRREIQDRGQALREQISDAGRRAWELEKEVQDRAHQLDTEVAGRALGPVVRRLQERYRHLPRVAGWLGRVERELVGYNVPEPDGDQEMAEAEAAAAVEMAPLAARGRRVAAGGADTRFEVNVLVHRQKKAGAPVVVETNPTYFNLFGKAELVNGADGRLGAGVMNIKAGSVHRANGGYLVLQAADVLRSPGSWEALKRALSTREIRIEVPDLENRMMPVELLRPQPIPLDVKVVLIGGNQLYQMLQTADEGFRKLFKIKSEFDVSMEASQATVEGYARFVSGVCRREGLLHLDASAVAQLVEHSHRLADDQTKLSARFNEIVQMIYEANAWATAENSKVVDGGHVLKAVREREERSASPQRHLQEMIERGAILVDVDGAVVGQVNGLTVMNVGDYSFGSPSRITARVYTGQKGILHIEREIDMTGQIHDKGLFTLSGFLGDRFAQDKPLSFSASIAFEQTYVPVDGDSASSTELYALLSALADVPIEQGIAVTGSVNQRGEVQAIGGVNEKIEGFFRICTMKGLTGRQGVMIPRQNLSNLMLSQEVVAAVQAGEFHVWAVGSIEEGVEILTGMPAGERQPDGRYPPGTLFERVDRKIEALVRNLSLWH